MLNYNGTALQVLLTSTCTSAVPALWSGPLEQIPKELIAMQFLKHYRKRGQCLFTVLSFLPHILVVSVYSERKYVYACVQMYTPPTTADPVKAWSPVLCFSVREWASIWILRCPERLEVFPSVEHHPSCHPLFTPYFRDACKGISQSFPALLWVEPAGRSKSCSREREKPGRQSCTHTVACAQRRSVITRLISLGNQIKKQSTLCQL